MKRILLLGVLALSLTLSAQPVLTVTLDDPMAGANLSSGVQFAWTITISNTGTATHKSPAGGDTCLYAPTVNGNLLTSGGQPAVFLLADSIPAGGSVSRTLNITLTGGTTGTLDICGLIEFSGSNYSGSTQEDDCATINWSAGISVGELRMQETFDNSYYSNGNYVVSVSSKGDIIGPVLEMVDISGRTVKVVELGTDGSEINQVVSMAALPQGIYIVRLKAQEGLISINKIIKQ